jgi:hypothetical protein
MLSVTISFNNEPTQRLEEESHDAFVDIKATIRYLKSKKLLPKSARVNMYNVYDMSNNGTFHYSLYSVNTGKLVVMLNAKPIY